MEMYLRRWLLVVGLIQTLVLDIGLADGNCEKMVTKARMDLFQDCRELQLPPGNSMSLYGHLSDPEDCYGSSPFFSPPYPVLVRSSSSDSCEDLTFGEDRMTKVYNCTAEEIGNPPAGDLNGTLEEGANQTEEAAGLMCRCYVKQPELSGKFTFNSVVGNIHSEIGMLLLPMVLPAMLPGQGVLKVKPFGMGVSTLFINSEQEAWWAEGRQRCPEWDSEVATDAAESVWHLVEVNTQKVNQVEVKVQPLVDLTWIYTTCPQPTVRNSLWTLVLEKIQSGTGLIRSCTPRPSRI